MLPKCAETQCTVYILLGDHRTYDVMKLGFVPGFCVGVILQRHEPGGERQRRGLPRRAWNGGEVLARMSKDCRSAGAIAHQIGERGHGSRQNIHLRAEARAADIALLDDQVRRDLRRPDARALACEAPVEQSRPILSRLHLISDATHQNICAEIMRIGQKVSPERLMQGCFVLRPGQYPAPHHPAGACDDSGFLRLLVERPIGNTIFQPARRAALLLLQPESQPGTSRFADAFIGKVTLGLLHGGPFAACNALRCVAIA